MAEISEGWDGTVDEAAIARIMAAATAPRIVNGFACSAAPGLRRVIATAGETHLGFIRYEKTDATIFDFPAPVGGRWYLLVQRRSWSENTVTHVALAGPTTIGTDEGPTPSSYPDGFENLPGVTADLPLMWAFVRSTDNQVILRSPARSREHRHNAGAGSDIDGIEIRRTSLVLPDGALRKTGEMTSGTTVQFGNEYFPTVLFEDPFPNGILALSITPVYQGIANGPPAAIGVDIANAGGFRALVPASPNPWVRSFIWTADGC